MVSKEGKSKRLIYQGEDDILGGAAEPEVLRLDIIAARLSRICVELFLKQMRYEKP